MKYKNCLILFTDCIAYKKSPGFGGEKIRKMVMLRRIKSQVYRVPGPGRSTCFSPSPWEPFRGVRPVAAAVSARDSAFSKQAGYRRKKFKK